MVRFHLAYLVALVLTALVAGCAERTATSSETDLLLYNGKIWTGDPDNPWATWVAVRNSVIVAVGDADHEVPDAAVRIDLDSRLTVPGFNDSHVHFAAAGALLLGINLLDVNDDASFIARVKECTERLPKGSWITRGDWGAYEAWGVGSEGSARSATTFTPHRALIDSISPDHPVLVTRYDRSLGLANAVALEYLGIVSEDGLLEGAVLDSARNSVPEKAFERRLAEARRALEECRKWGVTTVQDMSPLVQVDVYRELERRGELTCRINFAPSRLSNYTMMAEKGWVIDWDADGGPVPAGSDMISFGTLKSHIDGIMGARTARFFQPYADNLLENQSWRGGWREFSEDMPSFKRMLLAADSCGIQLRVHAIGDEANHLLLDILDTLDHYNGPRDRRFRLVHAQVIAPDDFQRFRGRGIVSEVQPYHVTDDMRWMEERIGTERCRGAYAFRTLQENGCVLSFGSDWPGTNASYYPVNPLLGIYAAVTRQTINGTPEGGWFPEQKLSLDEALRAYTWGSAYGAFEEGKKGTIAPGMLADLAVLDIDLFETQPSAWLEGQIAVTILGGRSSMSRNDRWSGLCQDLALPGFAQFGKDQLMGKPQVRLPFLF
ncbi:MAG: amidohydrolase [Saprospiraceae bacterium]|nr:amidohydrolase [Saprospiraceae bacterium]